MIHVPFDIDFAAEELTRFNRTSAMLSAIRPGWRPSVRYQQLERGLLRRAMGYRPDQPEY